MLQPQPELNHTTEQRIHRFLGPYLEVSSGEYFTVAALMREPVSWLGSWYRFRQRDDVMDPLKRTDAVSFDAFVQAWCSDEVPEYANVGSQSRFLKPKNGRGVDHLFRYENIADFVTYLEDRLDCVITLPRLNVSPEANLTLSPGTLALLHKVAAADFELYDSTPRG